MKKKVSERFINAIEQEMDDGYHWEYERRFRMAEEPFLKRFWTVFVYKLSKMFDITDSIARIIAAAMAWIVTALMYAIVFIAAIPFSAPGVLYAAYKGIREVLISCSIRRNPRYKALKTRYLETTKKAKSGE